MTKRSEGNRTTAPKLLELKFATGAVIKERRLRAGLKQKEVADAMGWSEAVQSQIEKGQRIVSSPELILLAGVIGEDAGELTNIIRDFKRNKPGKKPR